MVEDRGKVLWHTSMSLDGFITGPDEDMDWVFEYEMDSSLADEVMNRVGAILCGRRTFGFDSKREETDGAYGGRWSGPVLCLTHEAPEGESGGVTFITEGIEAAIEAGLEAATGRSDAPGDDLLILGADTAGQAARAGLVDELIVHVAPVLLGSGTPLYKATAADPYVELERIGTAESGQYTDLRFRLKRTD